jgi:hypothetical protein
LNESLISTASPTITHEFVWDGVSPIRVTLAWTDPAGTATTTSDLRSPRLRNNLDLKVVGPNGSEHFPYVMPFVGSWTVDSMNLPATTGINNTDNVEQVFIATPPATGAYRAIVTFQGTLANNQQVYSLLVSGSANEVPPPPPLALSDISPASGLAGSVVTATVSGTALETVNSLRLVRSGEPDIAGSSLEMVGGALRAQFNLTGAAAGLWSVAASNADESAVLENAFAVVGAIWVETFDGTVSGWTSNAVTGSNQWSLATDRSHSAPRSYFAPAPVTKTTVRLTSPVVNIPASATDLQLRFWHRFDLQSRQDGGRFELSVDGGSTWFGVDSTNSGVSFASNGYNSTILATGAPKDRSDFADQRAWSGNSNGFIETVLNFNSTAKFAGKAVRFRWILATNGSTNSPGWHVDSIALLGGGDLSNEPPTIPSPIAVATSETMIDGDGNTIFVVRAASVGLSVTAADDGGEANLGYTWSAASASGAPVFFLPNGSNAAKQTVAQFEAAGDYTLSVTVKDPQGLAASSSALVRVAEVASGITVDPSGASITFGGSQQFIATVLDQFGEPMTSQPSVFSWSAAGGGSINSSGLFSSSAAGGPFAIAAAHGGLEGIASVTVNPAPASITLGNLEQVYSGGNRQVVATTDPGGLDVAVLYNGLAELPVAAGAYVVDAAVTDPNFQGAASAVLTVAKAPAAVSLGDLEQIADGEPKPVSFVTEPVGLEVVVTYEGSLEAPSVPGSYAVVATVTEANYAGSASATLVIVAASGDDYEEWLAANKLSGPDSADNADPDGDGIPNLLEFVLGGSPLVPHSATAPRLEFADDEALFTFSRSEASLGDVDLMVEVSSSLSDWSGATQVPIETSGVVEVRIPIGDREQLFVRLRAIRGVSGSP